MTIAPAASAARPLVAQGDTRPVRAWLSGIDGTGSRASWILFEGPFGALRLCSLILNDEIGILDAAGGDITRKRLERELAELAASQKLPWVEIDPGRAAGLVAEALARHRDAGTAPPAAFERWRPRFDDVPAAEPPALAPADPALVERSTELLNLPELNGWFLEPERVQPEAVEMLQARESRLVVSDQIKAEHREAVITRVVERELTPEVRGRWARRLAEMALVFDSAGRGEHAALAGAAAAELGDDTRDVHRHPFARQLAARALEVAGEVALGRLSAADATRRPSVPGTGHPRSDPGSRPPLGAFLFDLNVGDARARPTREMGYDAAKSAAAGPVAEGSVGAGPGATVGKVNGVACAMRGGVGYTAAQAGDIVVTALMAVNAVGDVRDPETGVVIAGTREAPDSRRLIDSARAIAAGAGRFEGPRHTTIGVVTTNARLTKIEAAKVASLAMVGFGRALSPPHTAFDGDSLFVLSVGDVPFDLTRVGVLAADAVARAIARGVRAATSLRDIPAARDLAAI